MKNLSSDNRAMWLKASTEFTAKSLRSEIQEVIKWAPSLRRSGEDYFISRKSIPANVWEAMCEIEEWGMADRLDEAEGEYLRIDASLLDLVMETIKLLLKVLLQPQRDGVVAERHRLAYDDCPTLV
ncbi:hypothetical protein RBU55_30230 [Pseudomonas chlororaphis subsp. aurantiaca]|uniref:hypothetical protein n=1 Tax=Pseudomonas chlororaphis TaxID=587753 RepID=UPI0027DE9AAC|nr:hypothetical protein [Pseudomonas chlororaphis]WMI99761.1 hypothetical protein RBU55_30230 [Pseudomonas chlororaphis subsp. aurantiaca]